MCNVSLPPLLVLLPFSFYLFLVRASPPCPLYQHVKDRFVFSTLQNYNRSFSPAIAVMPIRKRFGKTSMQFGKNFGKQPVSTLSSG